MTAETLRDRVYFPNAEIEIPNLGWNGDLTQFIREFKPHSNYDQRGQKSNDKITEDHYLSKATEWGCAEWLLDHHGFPWLEPDFDVYPYRLRDYQADLPYSTIDPALPDVSVKASDQRAKMNFELYTGRKGYSWVFGKTEDAHPKPDDLCVFMYADTWDTPKERVIATAPWRLIVGLLEPPYNDSLTDKAVICSDRLEALSK